MFTGLVESLGDITSIEASGDIHKIVISPKNHTLLDQQLGASIAVNGCCLTVMEKNESSYGFEVSSETLALTSLGDLKEGDQVNLERAMALGDRLGGHLVSGHIDGMGTVSLVDERSDGWLLKITFPGDWSHLVIHKGSICIDGVSLTINRVIDEDEVSHIELMIIPTTLKETTIDDYSAGRKVNLEFDMIAKFAARQLKN
ncbi:MAG: riboflavin synthase [Pseudobacteriovorax sp.]|nr:riboflavin synthase [Pseudobacteriovorax sp.]